MTHMFDIPVASFKDEFGLELFVETGCEFGEALQRVKSHGFMEHHLYSCDIRKEAVEMVRAGLPQANLFVGDSITFLRSILQGLNGPTLFWLDAHFPALYSHEETAQTRWPLLEELELIKALKRGFEKDVIMCDDMRVLKHPSNSLYTGEAVGFDIEVDWDYMLGIFGDTHDSIALNVDTGVQIFVPKK
jgi:hypothetical protein